MPGPEELGRDLARADVDLLDEETRVHCGTHRDGVRLRAPSVGCAWSSIFYGMATPDTGIRFRRLVDEDLTLLHRWLNAPAVVAWWEGRDVSMPAVVRDFSEANRKSIEFWIATRGDVPFGFVQTYLAETLSASETYYWSDVLDLRRGGGIDYFLGDEVEKGRGLGSAMIRAFVLEVAFVRNPEWDYVAAGPFSANVPSCRALEKAGFRERVRLADPEGDCSLMVFERDAS